MKKPIAFIFVSCAGLIFLASRGHIATAGIEDPPVCGTFAAGMIDEIPGGVAGGLETGLNFASGFEPGEGYSVGYISNAGGTPAGCGGPAFPCWGHTEAANASLITPTIENIHPASGVHHLRLIYDPSTRTNQPSFGLGVDARYPRQSDLSSRPVAPNTVSVDVAISNPGGMDFRIQPQSNSQGLPSSTVLFFYTGGIYLPDDCANESWFYTGFDWDTTGSYRNYTVVKNPCQDTFDFYYDGVLIHSTCVGIYWGTNLEQIVLFGDNYPGSYMDVDNVVMESENECPATCGNGIIEAPVEQCEPGLQPNGCNPGLACAPAGGAGECTCSPSTGCLPGTPLTCDDGNYCNGMEFCNPSAGCVSGTPPCADDESCDEDGDQCIPNSIPTVSQWGLVVLTIVLLVAAKVQFRRRRMV